MTSTPASRSALATTLAPRSWPSRPGLAMTTLMAPMRSSSCYSLLHLLQLLDGRVAQYQVLDTVIATEIDLGFRVVARALDGQDRAQPVRVVRHLVPWRQGRHPPVTRRADPRPPRQALRGGRDGRRLVPAPLDEAPGDLIQEPGPLVILRPAPPGPGEGPGQVQPALRPGDPDVGQPALFLEFLVVVQRPLVWEDVLLHPGEEHHREFQALGGVQGHQRHQAAVVLALRDLVGVGDQGHLLQEVREGARCWPRAIPRISSAWGLRVDPPGHRDKLVEVLDPARVLQVRGLPRGRPTPPPPRPPPRPRGPGL